MQSIHANFEHRELTRWGRLTLAPRRNSGVSNAPPEEMGQPQDGVMFLAPETVPVANALRHEPEDALLTGGRRSLLRRVLGLNVTHAPAKLVSALPVFLRKTNLQPARTTLA